MSTPRRQPSDSVVVDAVIPKRSSPVVVEAIVLEAHNHCVALRLDAAVFGPMHIVAKPQAVHASIGATREKMLEEIRFVEMADSTRVAVEAIVNKYLR